jgi:hypothetical protein
LLPVAWTLVSYAGAIGIVCLALLQCVAAVRVYQRLEPSGLPGSRLLRLARDQADFYRRVLQATRTHGRSFFTMPGLGSFYLWAEAEPPTRLNATAWMTLFTPAQQSQVVQDLEKTPDLWVIRWNPGVGFWTAGRDISANKIVRYIEDNFVTVESSRGCDIMVRRPAADQSGGHPGGT